MSYREFSGLYFGPRIKGFAKDEGVRAFFLDAKRKPRTRYCPQCLGEQPAYYRKDWLLLTSPACFKHGVILRDRCHCCKREIRLQDFENELAHERYMNVTVNHAEALKHCPTCLVDLSLGEVRKVDQPLLQFIARVSSEISSKPGGSEQYSRERLNLGACFSSPFAKKQLRVFVERFYDSVTYYNQLEAEYMARCYHMIFERVH